MRHVVLALVALLPSLASATSASDLWREALAEAGTRQFPSQNENGYRVDVTAEKASEAAGATVVRVSFAWSEIDTEREEPAFGKARPLPRRNGLPAQVVIGEKGVWVLSTPRKPASIRRLLKTQPTFPAEGGAAGVVERPLRKGTATCFTIPGPTTKKASEPVELCLAPGAGIVAAKGIVPQLEGVLFAQSEWVPPAE